MIGIEQAFYKQFRKNAEAFLNRGRGEEFRIALSDGNEIITYGCPDLSEEQRGAVIDWFVLRTNGNCVYNPIGYVAEVVVKDIFDTYLFHDGYLALLYAPYYIDCGDGQNRGMDYILCYWDTQDDIYKPIIGIDVTFSKYPPEEDDLKGKHHGYNHELDIPVIVLSLCYDDKSRRFKFGGFLIETVRNDVRLGRYDYRKPLGCNPIRLFISEILRRLNIGFTIDGIKPIQGLDEIKGLVKAKIYY